MPAVGWEGLRKYGRSGRTEWKLFAGAEARGHLVELIGPTEVVPLLQSPIRVLASGVGTGTVARVGWGRLPEDPNSFDGAG